MHRDRLTTVLWVLLAFSLGILLWRAWVRAADPPGAVTAADAAWAAARVAASFVVLAALALAAWRSGSGASARLATGRDGRFRRLVALALAGTLVVGMSGAVSALAAAAGIFKDLRILHPLIAVVVSLVLLRLVSAVRQGWR